jgi:hypothetical protein
MTTSGLFVQQGPSRDRLNSSSVADPDPRSGAFLPQGSGSGMIFFPKWGTTGKTKFCLKYGFNYDLFLHEKGKFIFPFSYKLFVGSISGIRIRDKRRTNPDTGYQKMVGSGSGINIPDPQH